MSKDTTTNIAESIFDSISLIVEKRIANLDYDKTLICTVTDISEATQKNLYTVTDGSTVFKAQGDGTKYQVDDQVRVLIVNGDFSKEKYIQGKHSGIEETTKPITYVSPLDSVLKITDNLITGDSINNTFGIAANSSEEGVQSEIPLASIDLTDADVQNKDIFDTLYLSADFQTNFDRYNIRSGDYGIHLKLISQKIDKNNKITYDAYGLWFSAKKDMFGDPYAFKIYTKQEIKYSLSQWPENIIGLQLFLYQSGDFTYYDETKASKPITTYKPQKIDGTIISDIKVKNVIIGFGSEVTAIDNNKIKLYTNDLTDYHSDDNIVDTKKMQLLWYNRTENNEYLGFSDGVFNDGKYLEDDYLKTTAKNTRLLQRQTVLYPLDQISLSLAADIYDIESNVKNAASIIGKDLYQTLQGFEDYMFGVSWTSSNPFDSLLNGKEGLIGVNSEALPKKVAELKSWYDNTLKYAKNKTIELTTLPDDKTLTVIIQELENTIKGYITSINNEVDKLLTTIEGIVVGEDAAYPAYKDVYETYKIRLEKITSSLEEIEEEIEKLAAADTSLDWKEPETPSEPEQEPTEPDTPVTVEESAAEDKEQEEKPTYLNNEVELLYKNSNAVLLNNIREGILDLSKYIAYVDITTTEEFKAANDNRYCIYWYRYDMDYLGSDLHMPVGWERLTALNNYCLPDKDEKKDFHQAKSNKSVEIYLREKQEERFKVVLFYNHKKFESEELVFTNLTPLPDPIAIDANGALTLEHKKDSQDSYQLYGANGNLLNAADAQVKRELQVHFSGETGSDEQLIGAHIYWYIPTIATMLTIFDSDVKNDYHDERLTIYEDDNSLRDACKRRTYKANRTNVIKDGNTYKFCSVTYNEAGETDAEKYIIEKTDIPAKLYKNVDELIKDLTADTTKEQFVGEVAPFKIYRYNVSFWEDTGKTIDDLTKTLIDSAIVKPGYDCYHKFIGAKEDGITVKVEDTIFPYHIKDYYQSTSTQNTILCVVKKDDKTYQTSQSFEFTSYGNSGTDYTLALTPNLEYPFVAGDEELSVQVALYDVDNKQIDIDIPLAEWMGPTGYTATNGMSFNGYNIKKDNNDLYTGILKCEIKNIDIKDLGGEVTLTSYLPIPYGNTKYLYIEGASSILYDSNGSNPQYYKKPYKLYDKLENKEITTVNWTLEYYTKSNINYNGKLFTHFWLTTSKVNTKNVTYIHFEGAPEDGYKASEHPDLINAISLNYLPRLDASNNIIPSGVYITYPNSDVAIYPVVFARDTSSKEIKWAQPIYISQNNYSSAVLNKWNGELTIDEKNGTILSTMVGAGRKNNQNQFEGVLMGDVAASSGDNAITETGLYGFHNGAQSFGFKIDGTAFIGKSGKGRINFDGDTGTITSGNYTSSSGMKIDLDDGAIDAYNFTLTSNNILIQSGENVETFFRIKDNDGNILMHMGSQQAATYNLRSRAVVLIDNNYMQSSDFNISNKTGLNIDFSDGKITGYNFTLRGENSQGSYFNLSSDATKFFEIHYKDTNKDPDVNVSVIKIDTNDYYLHSFDWIPGAQGTEIDLENGRWLSYCNTGTYDGKGILINAADTSYPLVIGGSGTYDKMYENATFKVAWDGSLSIGTNFITDAEGKIIATGAELIDLKVTNDATFIGSIKSTDSAYFDGSANFGGTASFGGNTKINGSIETTGVATLGGDTTISGMCTITTGLKINTPNLSIGDAVAVSGHHTLVVDQPWKPGIELEFANGILVRYGDVEGGKVDESWNDVASTSTVTALANRVTTLENNYNSLSGKVTTLESNYNSLSNKVTTLESNYNSLSSKVTTLEDRITALEKFHSSAS